MSGIFGIYHPDSKPIHQSHLQGMANGISHRGPDGTKTLIQPHIGFGHSMLHTTPESLTEILPYTDPESKIIITADARIDNREELFSRLRIQQKSSITDSQLILEAYKKWGTEAISRLVGDFAFSLWDPSNQRLICARDYIGVKPFYYHYNSGHFLFSSEIKQLAEHPDVILKPNESMVAEYLSYFFCSKTETLFQGINRLAPAHFMIISSQDFSCHRYWSFRTNYRIHYKNSNEYTEHFLEIFEKSVKSRLRSSTPICAELSGGLDSSSVVGMACKILGKTGKEPLQTYSMVFPGIAIDERQYIKSVSEKHNIETHYINSLHPEKHDTYQHPKDTFEPPDTPNITMCNNVYSKIATSKARVVLSGIGGDEWFSGSGYPYLDFLKYREFTRLIAHLKHSASTSKLRTAKSFSLNTFWPLIPKRFKKSFCNNRLPDLPPWLPNNFIVKTNLLHRIQNNDIRPTMTNLSNLTQFSVLHSASEAFFLESTDRHHSRYQIEYRSPFLDKNIAEFSLGVPDYELQNYKQSKAILRHKSNLLLPKTVRKRLDKAEFSYFFNKIFINEKLQKRIRLERISSIGWVNHKRWSTNLTKRREQCKNNLCQHEKFTWETWFGIAIANWYQSIFDKTN